MADLQQILQWFTSGSGRLVAAGSLFVIMWAIKSHVPTVDKWLGTDSQYLSSKRKKLLANALLATAPAAMMLTDDAVPLQEVAITWASAFLGSMGLQSGQKAARTKSTASPPAKPGTKVGPVSLVLLAPLLISCNGAAVPIARATISTAVDTNNAMVAALQKIHDRTKADRSAAMKAIAAVAPDEATGLKQIDSVDKRYRTVFETFQKAEVVQHALAEALEVARAAVDAGEALDMASLLVLYQEAQGLYNAILVLLAEVNANALPPPSPGEIQIVAVEVVAGGEA